MRLKRSAQRQILAAAVQETSAFNKNKTCAAIRKVPRGAETRIPKEDETK
jgi:hypothetical protein